MRLPSIDGQLCHLLCLQASRSMLCEELPFKTFGAFECSYTAEDDLHASWLQARCLTSASRASLMPVASSCWRLALSKASTKGVSSSGVFSWMTSWTCTNTVLACKWCHASICKGCLITEDAQHRAPVQHGGMAQMSLILLASIWNSSPLKLKLLGRCSCQKGCWGRSRCQRKMMRLLHI